MSVVNDKQFYIILGLGAVGVVAGGYYAYKAVKAVTGAVGGAVDYVKNDAATDALGVAGDVGTFIVGEPTAGFLGGMADLAGDFLEWSGINDVKDKFDLNYRDKQPNMNDEEYQRWKTAVQNGDIQNPFKQIF
jgi:hypothetical protein